MFEKVCGVKDESQIQLDQFLKDDITEHLQSLEKKVEHYFPRAITGTGGPDKEPVAVDFINELK